MKLYIFVILLNLSISTILFAQPFVLITDGSGLEKSIHSNGIAAADYDLDGDLDLYIVGANKYDINRPETWNNFYKNNGDGTFTDITDEANVRGGVLSPQDGFEGSKFGAAWGDYDNDGDPDLYITNFGYNILYKNNGDGTFSDISESAGVRGPINDQHSSSCWWDYNLDGDLDIYVCANNARNILYKNNGNDTFSNVVVETGLGDRGNSWAAIPFDANNDGLKDLYVVNDFGANTFYLNNNDGTFIKYTEEAGLEDEGNGMGVTLGDYNNDGFFDIYLTNISDVVPCPLFENQGNGTFENIAAEAGVSNTGWAWGTDFFDFDHNGMLDLAVVNGHAEEAIKSRNFFFNNLLESNSDNSKEGTYFQNVADSLGVDSDIEARGLLPFDYDNDGDLDMLVGNWWTIPHLYANEADTKNWLKVKLQGTVSNRNAFGATVSATCSGKKYFRSNDGVDFLGQSIMPLHFGLADSEIIDTISVVWPTGIKEIITNVSANQTIKIVEQQGLVSVNNDGTDIQVRSEYYLSNNYPNPFNPSTSIEYSIPEEVNSEWSNVKIIVYDELAREVAVLVDKAQVPGNYNVQFNTGNLASGVYFYTLRSGNIIISKKMLLLK